MEKNNNTKISDNIIFVLYLYTQLEEQKIKHKKAIENNNLIEQKAIELKIEDLKSDMLTFFDL